MGRDGYRGHPLQLKHDIPSSFRYCEAFRGRPYHRFPEYMARRGPGLDYRTDRVNAGDQFPDGYRR